MMWTNKELGWIESHKDEIDNLAIEEIPGYIKRNLNDYWLSIKLLLSIAYLNSLRLFKKDLGYIETVYIDFNGILASTGARDKTTLKTIIGDLGLPKEILDLYVE